METAASHIQPQSLNRLAVSATTHCLTGCAIGEILGMAIATGLGWGDFGRIALAVGLAYMFGFGLTAMPLVRPASPPALWSRPRWRPTQSRSGSWRR